MAQSALSVRQQVSFSVVIFLALSFVDLKGPRNEQTLISKQNRLEMLDRSWLLLVNKQILRVDDSIVSIGH